MRSKQSSWIRGIFAIGLGFLAAGTNGQVNTASDWVDGRPDACTSITVGRKASDDGSVRTSHTCDSHRTTSAVTKVAPQTHPRGSVLTAVSRANDDSQAMPLYKYIPMGQIPQAERTYGYINTAYPCINDHQLAVGESTFGGRAELQSDKGWICCEQLVQLMIERCRTAREAIRLADEITGKYGYNDSGECLTIADPQEVWHLEIVGPGKDKIGAIWVAQRVPDDHVSVNANASRIRTLDLSRKDFFMASKNAFAVARENGWWKPEQGPFEFNLAYDPEGRQSLASRRREWRVLSLLAPSLKLGPESENYPFSVKPDTLVTLAKMVSVFQDYYEGTDFNFVKNITTTDKDGKTVISPLANPFMPYDMNPLFKINGGWGGLGERTIARWYTMYATITQSRSWLPDEIGGVVWLAFDNAATSVYVPFTCAVTDMPETYKVCGRIKGFGKDSAWWAFNRLGTIAAQRWGDMRRDVEAVWKPFQAELYAGQKRLEAEVLSQYKSDPEKAVEILTRTAITWGDQAVQKCWDLGDALWTKYDEKF